MMEGQDPQPIAKHDVMPLLLDACPSFRDPWCRYVTSSAYVEGRLHIDLGEFARHFVAVIRDDRFLELPAVCDVIEQLHLNGDDYVREAATIGLLETIQSAASRAQVDTGDFVIHLRTESAKWWREVDRFWSGEAPYVGAGLKSEG